MLGLRLLWRDWRGGELGILVAAIITAVAIVTGISLFADRLQQGIVAKSSSFLAADRVIEGSRVADDTWLNEASILGLKQARIISFSSMVFANESIDTNMQLAAIKAVTNSYPLRGELEVSEEAYTATTKTTESPQAGEVWLDPRLFPLLDVSIGDRIFVGEAHLLVTKVVVNEPDGGSNFIGLGPRVLMNYSDIEATGIIQPGSRVSYRYLFSGNEESLSAFGDFLKPLLAPTHKWLILEDAQPRIAQSLQRAEDFLLLAGALGVGLAGIAIALAARRYSERHYDYVAVMKSLGASSRRIMTIYITNLLLLAVLATLLGCGLGWLIQQVFIVLLQQYFDVSAMPSITIRPFIIGSVTALVCLLAFALPPLLNLKGVSPLRVLRRDIINTPLNNIVTSGVGVLGIAGLMYWYSGNLFITLAVLAGIAVTVFVVGGVAWYLLRGVSQVGMNAGSSWRLALASMRRRGYQNAIQAVIFSLSIMLLLLLALVRGSLIEEWQVQLPEGTPNHFLVNVAEQDVTAVGDKLSQSGITREAIYPIVRGRVTSINETPFDDWVDSLESTNGDRPRTEYNLTWSEELPFENELEEGIWWSSGFEGKPVSIESGFAKEMQLKLGDTIQLSIGSESLIVTVSSIRNLNWDSMRPNFFMIMPPALLKEYPATYITSFYLPPEQKRFLNAFLLRFPTVSVIEMDSVIKQIRSIVNQVSRAIELVLGLIIVSGLLVLIASVQASLDSRLHESAILRTLGASRGLVLGSLIIEFSALGVLAGFLAAFSAELSVYALQTYVLDMSYTFHPWVWWVGPVLGALLIGSAGYITCRKVVNMPPVEVLRML